MLLARQRGQRFSHKDANKGYLVLERDFLSRDNFSLLKRVLRVDLFVTYAYSRRLCPLEFFLVFKLKNNESTFNVSFYLSTLHRSE